MARLLSNRPPPTGSPEPLEELSDSFLFADKQAPAVVKPVRSGRGRKCEGLSVPNEERHLTANRRLRANDAQKNDFCICDFRQVAAAPPDLHIDPCLAGERLN